ncbi:MAG: iron ABC transporter substrate-binding protein [Chloroflexi bacterium]|nr:iron ABC transporter substrate-binding protein [Chloroflexota bacterium]
MTTEISNFVARRSTLMALGLAMALILVIACSSDEDGDSVAGSLGPGTAADPQTGDEIEAIGGKLVIYSGRSESLIAPLIKRFEEATGIDARVNYAGTGALAATLLEEGDRSPADVFFAQDPGGLGAIIELLDQLPDELIERVPVWARSPEKMWVGISGRARTVVYNTKNLGPEDLPDTMDGFTDPKWKGRIGWAPTNGSFQAMVTGMRLIWGEERTREWLEGIVANEPRVYAKNTPTVAAAGSGEIDVGFVNHYYLHRFLDEQGEGFEARNYFLPGGGPGSAVLVTGAGILKTAKNRAGAERFLDYLLNADAQLYFAEETFEYPLIDGVPRAELLPGLDELNTPDIDVSDLGDLAATQNLLRETGALP